MIPAAGDIYLVRAQWRESKDMRPCVVVDVVENKKIVFVSLISSAGDLYDSRRHFQILLDDPNFKATGLRKSSYCDDIVRQVSLEHLGKRLGCLQGSLALQFQEWFG